MASQDNRVFVGLICKFSVNVALPSQPAGWHFDLSVLPPDHFRIEDAHPRSADAPSTVTDARFYHVMAERAFDELRVKLRNVLFKRGSDAYFQIGGARQGQEP